MNETFWIVGEIIVGIAVLGVLSAVVTAVMVPFLDHVSKRHGPAEILEERYARGELTREQFQRMRQDLGIELADVPAPSLGSPDGREEPVAGSRQTR